LGISRQAYYQYWKRVARANERDQKVLSFVIHERALRSRLGGRKLHFLMNQASIDYTLGRDKLFDLLRVADITYLPVMQGEAYQNAQAERVNGIL